MAHLSGYDSEAVGFKSVTQKKNTDTHSSTQTTEFSETTVDSQTNASRDYGCNVSSQDLKSDVAVPREYPPPGLNEFLRRVVPAVMEQLDQTAIDTLYNSSDSEEEDFLCAKLFQELQVKDSAPSLGAGDHQAIQAASILSVTWSSAGNSVAVSLGQSQHENWCEHDGLIRIYTTRRIEGDKFVHNMDITEKNCITVLKYHPAVAALLAYGTTSGEVVLCNLRNVTAGVEQGMQLTSPSGTHSSNRVTALQWADATLTNAYLLMQVISSGKRRGAADQVLISSGCDGTVNVWQVNVNLQVFQNIICYKINGARKMAAPEISCFDFIKNYPLRPSEQKNPEDIFVVGTTTGQLYLCNLKKYQSIVDSAMVDPVYEVLEGHSTCVLDVAFSLQKAGIFVSISMDSELRVYDVQQSAPLKVLCMEDAISSMCWVPNNPCLLAVGLANVAKSRQLIKIYNVSSGRPVAMEGLHGGNVESGTVTSVAVSQSGCCRIAAGDANSTLRIWDVPLRRLKLTSEDLEF